MTAAREGWGVAAMSGPRPSGRRPSPFPVAGLRSAWLVLATTGLAAHLEPITTMAGVTVVGDPRRFRELLLADRPRIAVCSQPPASIRDLELVVAERRRRIGLRIIHLSPPNAVAERLAALALGFDDALTAGVTSAELIGRLAWHDARVQVRSATPPVLRFGDGFQLDLAAHDLRRHGVAIHLRPKEFGLLVLLASHPGRAYTRAELLDQVWGPGHDGIGRTVDVHVRWLRSKIETDPEHPVHLVTVRGVGYRLDAAAR